MIEIEKKIEIVPSFLEYVTLNGSLLSKKSIKDTYYDNADFRFTTQNIWLRERENVGFELKRAIKRSDLSIDRYEEITDLNHIREILGLYSTDNFVVSLQKASIQPFATLITHREKYQLSELTVDVDVADFGDFIYRIAEIECLVEKEEEISKAELQINDFLKKFAIDLSKKPQAKLTHYLNRCRPEHYKALQRVNIV